MNERPAVPPSIPVDRISLIELANVILKHRRLVMLLTLLVVIPALGWTLTRPRDYTASASFITQTGGAQRSLGANLAAQFGISLPVAEPGQSPAFYADLLRSREILDRVIDSTYVFGDGQQTIEAPLPELLRVRRGDPEQIRARALQVLRKHLGIGTGRETGLVSFSVRTRWAALSHQLAEAILYEMNRFNLETRQSQAGAERRFVESRLIEAEAGLNGAEAALQDFLQKNRSWRGDPALEFMHDRLQREVSRRQQIFNSLNQSYEQARIDEVRDTPVISVVDRPMRPVLPDRRGLAAKGLMALMGGLVLGIMGAFGREFMARGRRREAEPFAEFERLKADTLADLRRPWRIVRRRDPR